MQNRKTYVHTIKKNPEGKWIKNPQQLMEIKEFLKNLPPGTEINIFYETPSEKKTLAQLRYIHSIINEISINTGQPFDTIKDIIKYKTGIKQEDDTYKSFADYTKDEMIHAIYEAIELANFVGVNIEIISDLLKKD